jgi:hypothetical protein
MNYDDYFEAAGIIRSRPHHDDRFSWSDLRKLVDYFVVEKSVQEIMDHNHKDFEIQRVLHLGGYIIRKVHYPDCPQGIKIMVHKEGHSVMNPHFGDRYPPVARFEPTEEGWAMAIQFASSYIS